jgi:hypothetical protein
MCTYVDISLEASHSSQYTWFMHAVYLSNDNYLESEEYIHTNISLEVKLKSMASTEYQSHHNTTKMELSDSNVVLFSHLVLFLL